LYYYNFIDCFIADLHVDFADQEWEDINIISGALKLFLRELPDPLIPFSLYNKFIEAGSEYLSNVFINIMKSTHTCYGPIKDVITDHDGFVSVSIDRFHMVRIQIFADFEVFHLISKVCSNY